MFEYGVDKLEKTLIEIANISKKNKVITSLENTLKQLKKDEKSN